MDEVRIKWERCRDDSWQVDGGWIKWKIHFILLLFQSCVMLGNFPMVAN